MRLLIHQAWKDILQLRWILAVWVLVTVALHAVVFFGVQQPPSPADVPRTAAYMALLAISIAGFFVIPVLVVQTDPGVGTTAFWFTRPISRSAVVAAKFIVIVPAVVLLPVVLDFLTLVAAGVPAAAAARPFLGSLGLQLIWTLPLMAVAAFTTTLAQFVLCAIVEVIAFMGTVGLMSGLVGVRTPLNPNAAVAVSIGALLVLALVVLVTAYWWRDQRRSTVVAVAGPVGVVMLTLFWPWTLQPRPPGRQLPATVRIDPSSAHLERYTWPDGRPMGCSFAADVDFTQVPSNLDLRPSKTAVTFRVDSNVIDGSGGSLGVWRPDSARTTASVPNAFGGGNFLRNGRAALASGGMSPAVCDQIVGRQLTVEVVFRFSGTSQHEIAALPLSAGERFTFPNGSGLVERIERDKKLLAVTIGVRAVAREPSMRDSDARFQYVLRNSRLGQTLMPATQRLGESNFVSMFVPVPQHLGSRFATAEFGGSDNPGFDPSAWLRDGRLVVVETADAGLFQQTVTLPNIVLPVR